MAQRSFRSLIPKHSVRFGVDLDWDQRVPQTLDSRSPQPSKPWELPVAAAGGWPALAAVAMPLPRCGSSGRRVMVRTSGSVRRAADGQQPTAVETNSTVAELWQIVGALGRCCLGYLQPSDDPSRSLTIRCSCRARLLGSDTEEVTWAAPEVPSSHRSAVRNRGRSQGVSATPPPGPVRVS
jgi:hypothetical protein